MSLQLLISERRGFEEYLDVVVVVGERGDGGRVMHHCL
jgi:hypothetical protein